MTPEVANILVGGIEYLGFWIFIGLALNAIIRK